MEFAEPDMPKRTAPTGPEWWRTGILIVALVVLFTSSLVSLRGGQAEKSSVSAQLYLESMQQARGLYFMRHLPIAVGASPSEVRLERQTIANFRKLATLAPSPGTIRRLAIMQYLVGDPDWTATLLRLRDLPGHSPIETERELDMWRTVFSGHPTPQQASAIRMRIEGMNLAWFRYPALEALYHNAGMPRASTRVATAAQKSYWLLMMLLILGLFAGFLGLALGAALLYYHTRWRRRHQPSEAPLIIQQTFEATPPEPLSRDKADVLYTGFLVYLVTFAVLRLVASYVLRPLLAAPAFRNTPASSTVLSVVLMLVALAVPALVLVALGRRVGLRASDIGYRSSSVGRDILWGIGGYLVALPLIIAANLISALLFRNFETPLNPAVTEFASAHSLLMQALLFTEAAIIAPIAEETMFRGVFFRSLSPRVGRVAALLIASGVFAILHPQLPLGFLAIFVLGAVFNALYAMRGSLIPNMVAHATNNAIVFFLLTLLLGG